MEHPQDLRPEAQRVGREKGPGLGGMSGRGWQIVVGQRRQEEPAAADRSHQPGLQLIRGERVSDDLFCPRPITSDRQDRGLHSGQHGSELPQPVAAGRLERVLGAFARVVDLTRHEVGDGQHLLELDLERQREIRASLPALANRRPAAYRWPDREAAPAWPTTQGAAV